MIIEILVPFISILFTELGDKTQLAVLSMSSKTNKSMRLFFGVFFAFLIIDGLAIYFGDIIFNYISMFWTGLTSGIIFIFFGLIGFLRKEEDVKVSKHLKRPFMTAFSLIFLAEVGDKSQIAAALFAGIYNPWLVFIGVMLALSILTIIAIYFGRLLYTKLSFETTEKVSNSIFLLIGLILLIGTFFA